MAEQELPTPRYDFYQTASHLIVAVYLKGYGGDGVKDQVEVTFAAGQVVIILPDLMEPTAPKSKVTLSPLYAEINPAESSSRVLSTKIELKLAKVDPVNWPTLLSTGETQSAGAGPSTSTSYATPQPVVEKPKPKRKNWDTLVDDEETKDEKDPNAGGEAALQKLFSTIYKDADDDTKRAMIKSYTESGGTTLSTDWSKIGQETTKTQPPEGMEAKRY